MKYFAEIKNNIVQRVIVADSKEWCVDNLGGEWVETFSDRQDKNYAGVGFIYVPEKDNFMGNQPFPSWTLDENLHWVCPKPYPNEIGPGLQWVEEEQEWKDINNIYGIM